ncbi:MAG: matrixin family metalloprotease [Runella sp.]
MKTSLIVAAFLAVFLVACQWELQNATPLRYITSLKNEAPSRLRQGCTFLYNIENSFSQLDNQIQERAIREGFVLWQKTNPNLRFLRYSGVDATLAVRFVPHSEVDFEPVPTPQGLVRGQVKPISAARRERNTHVILLDQDVAWTPQLLQQVVAHHIGLFLGLSTSTESGVLMNPIISSEVLQLSKTEATSVQRLYPEVCRDLACAPLPARFDVNKETSQKLFIPQQGTLLVKATGGIRVGLFLGISEPKGIIRGLFDLPIDEYNIVLEFPHAILMYRRPTDTRWTRCGAECEIPTDGTSECMEIIFHINDNNLNDNSGAYNVTVDYKK